jgi:hypothetical protein
MRAKNGKIPQRPPRLHRKGQSTHELLVERGRKWWPAYVKFTTPKKLRRSPLTQVARWIVHEWLDLSESEQGYFAVRFWEDLRSRGFKGFPSLFPAIAYFLWLPDTEGELFRAIADYIDALKARKGDRGRRLSVTENLYRYKRKVEAGKQLILSWRELRDKFWSDYSDCNANWQKFLRERGIPFKPVGQFRVRKRVRKSRNNTR